MKDLNLDTSEGEAETEAEDEEKTPRQKRVDFSTFVRGVVSSTGSL